MTVLGNSNLNSCECLAYGNDIVLTAEFLADIHDWNDCLALPFNLDMNPTRQQSGIIISARLSQC